VKPIKLTDAQLDTALGLEGNEMDNENTGNRKCWRVCYPHINGVDVPMWTRMTVKEARASVARCRDDGEKNFQYCRDGFKLIPCDGGAHSNPHIDNCMKCAPRWGWVMVPDAIEEKRELTPVEKTLLGALK